MTDLIVRKMRFAFADHDVPFLWNEDNPAFSSMANAVSFLAIAFEKMIGAMIAEAMPLITDPEVVEEAQAFVRQEGQHSMAHRQHAKGLIKSYPGTQGHPRRGHRDVRRDDGEQSTEVPAGLYR